MREKIKERKDKREKRREKWREKRRETEREKMREERRWGRERGDLLFRIALISNPLLMHQMSNLGSSPLVSFFLRIIFSSFVQKRVHLKCGREKGTTSADGTYVHDSFVPFRTNWHDRLRLPHTLARKIHHRLGMLSSGFRYVVCTFFLQSDNFGRKVSGIRSLLSNVNSLFPPCDLSRSPQCLHLRMDDSRLILFFLTTC